MTLYECHVIKVTKSKVKVMTLQHKKHNAENYIGQ